MSALDALGEKVRQFCKPILFVGSGISIPKPTALPSWDELSKRVLADAAKHGIPKPLNDYCHYLHGKKDYYECFEHLQKELSEATYTNIITPHIPKRKHNNLHEIIAGIESSGIVTTNFDNCIEDAYAAVRGRALTTVSWTQEKEIKQLATRMPQEGALFKLHGTREFVSSMVLAKSQVEQVHNSKAILALFSATIPHIPFIFVGYSFSDPDFSTLWATLTKAYYFRHAAVLVAAKGQWSDDDIAKARSMSIDVIEFEDQGGDYAFVPEALRRIKDVVNRACGETKARLAAISTEDLSNETELSQLAFVASEFSPEKSDRRRSFFKSLILSALISAGKSVSLQEVLDSIKERLGRLTPTLRDEISHAILDLKSSSLIHEEYEKYSVPTLIRGELDGKRQQIDKLTSKFLQKRLAQANRALKIDPAPTDLEHTSNLFSLALHSSGESLARQIFNSQIIPGEAKQLQVIVAEYCKTNKLQERTGLFAAALTDFFLRPRQDEEEILFHHLQSHFLTNSYLLNPDEEKMMQDFVKGHTLYFDASVVLPSMAEGHPSHHANRRLIERSRNLGIDCRIGVRFANEISTHLRRAATEFAEYESSKGDIVDLAEASLMYSGGREKGNVFVAGYLGKVEQGSAIHWKSYLAQVAGTFSPRENDPLVFEHFSKSLGIKIDFEDKADVSEMERDRVDYKLQEVRHGRKTRPGDDILRAHEANQFLYIHDLRRKDEARKHKIWFITTDRAIFRLQEELLKEYPLPIAFTPRRWYQLLDLYDYEARSFENFGSLHPYSYFGSITGEIGRQAIRALIRERGELLAAGVLKAREVAEETLKNAHVRELINEFGNITRGIGPRPQRTLKDVKGELQKEVRTVAQSYANLKSSDWKKFRREHEALKKKMRDLEKSRNKAEFRAKQLRKKLTEANKPEKGGRE